MYGLREMDTCKHTQLALGIKLQKSKEKRQREAATDSSREAASDDSAHISRARVVLMLRTKSVRRSVRHGQRQQQQRQQLHSVEKSKMTQRLQLTPRQRLASSVCAEMCRKINRQHQHHDKVWSYQSQQPATNPDITTSAKTGLQWEVKNHRFFLPKEILEGNECREMQIFDCTL